MGGEGIFRGRRKESLSTLGLLDFLVPDSRGKYRVAGLRAEQ